MASVTSSMRYPNSMTVVLVGMTAVLLALLLNQLLAESMVAGLLGLWGIIIGTIGAFAVTGIWLLGKIE